MTQYEVTGAVTGGKLLTSRLPALNVNDAARKYLTRHGAGRGLYMLRVKYDGMTKPEGFELSVHWGGR